MFIRKMQTHALLQEEVIKPVYSWDKETKQIIQYKHKEFPNTTQIYVQKYAGKIMANVFWECEVHFTLHPLWLVNLTQ